MCAALRHLARGVELEGAAAPRASGDSVGKLGSEPVSLAGDADDDCKLAPLDTQPVDEEPEPKQELNDDDNGDAPVASQSEQAQALNQPASHTVNFPAASFNAVFQRLVEVLWVCFLRAQMVDAMFRGDVLSCAAWAIRFLGVAEPWSLRRTQELVVLSLELAVQCQGGIPGSQCTDDQTPEASVESLRFLQEACVWYFRAPIIPRFERRFIRSVASLRDQGVFSPSRCEDNGCANDSFVAKLDKFISTLLDTDSDAAERTNVQRDFDGSGKNLAEFRDQDDAHASFTVSVLQSALGHLKNCSHEVSRNVLAGVEVAALLQGDNMMAEKSRALLQDVLTSVPQPPRVPAMVVESTRTSDLQEFDDLTDMTETYAGSPSGLVLDEVELDVRSTEKSPAMRSEGAGDSVSDGASLQPSRAGLSL